MWAFLYIILAHWVSDFVLQTRHMATRKSTSNYYLTMHVGVYSCATMLFWSLLFAVVVPITLQTGLIAFSVIFMSHWMTDYFTSRQTSKYYKLEKYYQFFNVVGFDQVLHYVQLFLVYNYIILHT
jgi:hypothetical protein